MTETEFNMVLEWFMQTSGSLQMGNQADKIKREMPGVEPWTWRKAHSNIIAIREKYEALGRERAIEDQACTPEFKEWFADKSRLAAIKGEEQAA